jgi:demethylmenaquinone methyltransferase/2-methoxy-6-polyprenyl-1,4-benzoquinol methylase
MGSTDSRATYRLLARFYDLFDLIFLLGGKGDPRIGLIDALGGEPQRILDVCVGTAASAILVASRHANSHVVGIDVSDQMLAVARRKIGRRGLANVEVANASADAMPFGDGSFDAAMASFALHEFEPEMRNRILAEIARVVRPGGRFCLIDFARQDDPADRVFLKVWALLEPPCFRGFLDLDWRTAVDLHGLQLERSTEYSFSKLYVLRKV